MIIPRNKIALVKANINNYDELFDDYFMDRDIDYYYFTDGNKVPKGYIHVRVTEEMFPEDMPHVQKARLIKANPFKYIPIGSSYEQIIWVDSCFEQKQSCKKLMYQMRGYNLLTMQHPERDCVYHELNALIRFGIGDKEAIQRHFETLKVSDYPPANGLCATGIMFRRNEPEVIKLCELWEKLLSGDIYRDQAFFNYACWIIGLEYATFPYRERQQYFYPRKHLKSRFNDG